jgi:hypothetical protein
MANFFIMLQDGLIMAVTKSITMIAGRKYAVLSTDSASLVAVQLVIPTMIDIGRS